MSSAETRMTGGRVPESRAPSGAVPAAGAVPPAGAGPLTGAVPSPGPAPTGSTPYTGTAPHTVPPTGSTPYTDAVPPTEDEASLGQLVGDLTEDLSRLMRQELELAKAEIREEASKAGKAAGMLGAAGFAGYMTAVLLSLALAFALATFLGLGWATLVVAVLWAVAGFALFSAGRAKLRQVNPKPERTVETLKEDVEWARHPTK